MQKHHIIIEFLVKKKLFQCFIFLLLWMQKKLQVYKSIVNDLLLLFIILTKKKTFYPIIVFILCF